MTENVGAIFFCNIIVLAVRSEIVYFFERNLFEAAERTFVMRDSVQIDD